MPIQKQDEGDAMQGGTSVNERSARYLSPLETLQHIMASENCDEREALKRFCARAKEMVETGKYDAYMLDLETNEIFVQTFTNVDIEKKPN